MGSINLRIDDELKARSYAALEKMGVTPSEALRLMREHEKPRGSHRMMPSTGVKITTIIS